MQLTLVSLVALVPAAWADGEGQLRVYTDDDHVTVITPAATAHAPVGRRVVLGVETTIDVITAASVDVTSQASARPFHDTRVEGGADASWAASDRLTLGARGVGSIENDFRSLQLGADLAVDLARHDTSLALSWTGTFDLVGRAGDPRFARARQDQRVTATWTQVLDRRTYLDLVVEGQLVAGFQASPYRYVPIEDATGARAYALPEATPDLRAGAAVLARVRRALGEGALFLHADYRFYADSWTIASHTLSAGLTVPLLGGRLLVAARIRGYAQGAASFYRAAYVDAGAGAPAWRTRDRALGGMRSLLGDLSGDLAFGRVHLIAGIAAMRFVWLDFPAQSHRDALLLTLGVAAPL
jgi:hypothetical protein